MVFIGDSSLSCLFVSLFETRSQDASQAFLKLGVLLPQPSESWIAGVLAMPSSLEVSTDHHGVGLLPNITCLHTLRVRDFCTL